MLPENYPGFELPDHAGIHFTIRALSAIARSVDAVRLLKYFGAVDVFVEELTDVRDADADKLLVSHQQPGEHSCGLELPDEVDLCFAGFATRPNEIDWQTRLLDECLKQGLRVLFVGVRGSDQWRAAKNKIGLLKIELSHSATEQAASIQAISDWQHYQKLLRPIGLQINPDCFSLFLQVSLMFAAWGNLFERVQVRSLVVRNNHSPENVSAAFASRDFNIRVYSFQHSVLTSMPSNVPAWADATYCHGPASCSLLELSSVSRFGFDSGFRPIGLWNQAAGCLVAKAGHRRVLLADQECDWSRRYFRAGPAFDGIFKLVPEMLAQHPDTIWRVRAHFDNERTGRWEELAGQYPAQLELSAAGAVSLEDDLQDVSLVVGLFSTAVCESAHLGIPVVFLHEPGWFHTPDLADFAAVTLNLNEFKTQFAQIMNEEACYLRLRRDSADAASHYYQSDQPGLASVAADIKDWVAA